MLVIVIAVLQFTHFFDSPVGKWVVLSLAVVAGVCVIASEALTYREGRKQKSQQEARDQALIGNILKELRPLVVEQRTIPQPLQAPEELGMSANDPRIYIEDIKASTEAMFPKTPFVLHNRGKDVAHNVTITPFKLDRKSVTFPMIGDIPADGKKELLPEVEHADGLTDKHDIFHWLLTDWNKGGGEFKDEWKVPLCITYSDFAKKTFEAKMTLVFFPIRAMLQRNHNWPKHDYVTWEFQDMEFKRLS